MAAAARSAYLANNATRWIETATAQLREFPNLFAEPLRYDPVQDRIWAKLNIPKGHEISYTVHGLGEINSDQKFAAALNTDIGFSAFESGLYEEALKLTKTSYRVHTWYQYGYEDCFIMDVTSKKDGSSKQIALCVTGKNNGFFDAATGVLGLRRIDAYFQRLLGGDDSFKLDETVPETFQLPFIKI